MSVDWIELVLIPITGVALGFVGWYLRSSIETIRREKEDLQDKRRQIYIQILEPHIRIFAGIKNPSEANKAIRQVTSFDYRKALVELNLMGSDDVVRAMNDLMQYMYSLERDDTSTKPEDILVHWGGVLLAIRRDLGNKGTRLAEVDMLRGQIKDIDQFIKS